MRSRHLIEGEKTAKLREASPAVAPLPAGSGYWEASSKMHEATPIEKPDSFVTFTLFRAASRSNEIVDLNIVAPPFFYFASGFPCHLSKKSS